MSANNSGGDFLAMLVTVIVAAIVLLLVSAALAIIPVLIAIWLGFRLWHAYQNSPEMLEKKAQAKAKALYDAALAKVSKAPDEEEFAGKIYRQLPALPDALADAFIIASLKLFGAERFVTDVPEPPPVCNSVEGARYRDQINQLVMKMGDAQAPTIAQDTILAAFRRFIRFLPSFEMKGEIWGATPIGFLVDKIGLAVEGLIVEFYSDDAEAHGLFKALRAQFDRNLHAVSKVPFLAQFAESPKLVMPADYKGDDVINDYLKDTPLLGITKAQIPFTVPLKSRFEHHHIIAGSGHGKTQTLQYLITSDLPAVEKGQRSIIVIDSQGDLIRNIASLKCFAPGEPLHERICIIDPTDVRYPVSLNLFDVGQDRLEKYEMLERERLTNSILELYDFVLGSLLSAEMTQKQNVIFRYVTRLMLHIPDATIHTFADLLEPDGYSRFVKYIARLDGTARRFFETEFDSPQFKNTKAEVLRRLWGILENRTFERMFSHPRSKLDLYGEMNSGKIILINTAKDLLKENGSQIFGRFFIALIAQAAQERAVLPESQRLPTFVYVDEAAEYFDRNVEVILAQARKYKIGMILAHQYLSQLDPKLREAFAANTAIKFAGGGSPQDAKAMAQMMGCEHELISTQPKMSFVASIRGITRKPLPLLFPAGHLEAMERMTREERRQLRQRMRERYAVHHKDLGGQPDDEGNSAENDDGSGAQMAKAPGRSDARQGTKPTRPTSNPAINDVIIMAPPPKEAEPHKNRKRRGKPDPDDPDTPDTSASDGW